MVLNAFRTMLDMKDNAEHIKFNMENKNGADKL